MEEMQAVLDKMAHDGKEMRLANSKPGIFGECKNGIEPERLSVTRQHVSRY